MTLIFCMGASHRTASIELRESLYLTDEQLSTILPAVKDRFGFLELAAISTCNRFEIFGAARRESEISTKLLDAYLEMQRHAGKHGLSDDDVKSGTYLYLDDDAIRHVFRLSSSLDSLVVGETQITGQFKDATQLASRLQTIGPILGRLTQEALATSKRVRTDTDLGKRHVSISHAAIDLTKRVFGDLSAHRFLLIGAGEMAQVAAKYILSYNPKDIFVVNRNVDRAKTLVQELGRGQAFPLQELYAVMVESDIVISSTAAPGLVIHAPDVRRVQQSRRRRPLCLVDIALPRDIDQDCGKIDDVYLFDIDDLKAVVDANVQERQKAAEKAEVIVDAAVLNFQKWIKNQAITPILGQFRDYLADIIKRESERTLSRDIFKSLSPEQRDALNKLFEVLAAKIAADAARGIHNPPPETYADQLAFALEILFVDRPQQKGTPRVS